MSSGMEVTGTVAGDDAHRRPERALKTLLVSDLVESTRLARDGPVRSRWLAHRSATRRLGLGPLTRVGIIAADTGGHRRVGMQSTRLGLA